MHFNLLEICNSYWVKKSYYSNLVSSEKGAEELEEEKPPEPQGPPEPEPGSEDWEYVDQPIDVVCVTSCVLSLNQYNFLPGCCVDIWNFFYDAFTQLSTTESATSHSLAISFPQALKVVSFAAKNFLTKI